MFKLSVTNTSGATIRWSLVWQTVLLAHGVLAVAWWWAMPGGFPMGHVRYWTNGVAPWCVVTVAGFGVICIWRRKSSWVGLITISVPVAWTAALIAAVALFPISAKRFVLPALGGTVFLWTACVITHRGRSSLRWPAIVAVVLASVAGGIVPWTQRATDPDTRPLNTPLPEFESNREVSRPPTTLRLGEDFTVRTWDGSVAAKCGGLRIAVRPVLTFESRSPDRCWTILARRRDRTGSRRRLVALREEDDCVWLGYRDDATHVLRVDRSDDGSAYQLESFTRLEQPVFSHLNTFCEIQIEGHRRLSLSFSPCPTVRVDVMPADYPVGRPVRLAYLDAAGSFRVVQANSAEKGPFHVLGSGELARLEPLTIILYDNEIPACRVELADWARQVGTALSPTAGWGLPVGSIEFQRLGDSESAPAAIWVTLAGTSVGRGWDSVGHAAGTYRNRLRILPMTE